MIDRMVDRNISLHDVVSSFLDGHHGDMSEAFSFLASRQGVTVMVYDKAQRVRFTTCWRHGVGTQADIAWNLSMDAKVMRVLGVRQLPCLSYRGPLAPC